MELEPRSVKLSEVTMTELVLPSHTNALGSIFGGVIMSWIDIAAAIAAQRHSRSNVVTASIDALYFVAPIYTGWVVNLHAAVNYVSNTSMEVGVRIEAENPRTGERFHTTTAYLTFVALDQSGKPVKIPKVIPESADEKRRYDRAKVRRSERLKNKQSSK
jgi:acyl-CoA hydrolase